MSPLRTFALLVLLSIAPAAAAQQVPLEQRMSAEEFKAAGLDKLSASELANLNAWLDREPGATANASQALVPATETAAAPAPSAFAGASDQPVRSRLKGSVQTWGPGTVFELENGQRWRVMKGAGKLDEALQSPEIEVAPGLMGRWFLQVDEDMPRARVERIQ